MTYDTTLEEFRYAIKLCSSTRNTITNDQVEEYSNTLQYLLEHGHSPETVWDFLDNGSYKEVYVPFHKAPFVLKFCAADNDTDAEAMVITEANVRGLGQFFVSTYFIDLPTTLPATFLDDVCEYSSNTDEYTYVTPEINAIEVQPRIQVYHAEPYISDEHQNCLWEEVIEGEDCNCEPVDPDTADRLRRFIPYSDFARKLYQYHTNEDMYKLVIFMEEYGISDLHGSNLGFSKEDGRPLILDWMSR